MVQITKSSTKQKKIDQFQELIDKLKRAKALVLADYSGLTHKQLEELRKLLKKTQAEFNITKNSLLRRALNEVKQTVSDTHLNNATATLFAYADEVSPLKELVKFLKTATKGTIKVGILNGVEVTSADVEKMSALPSRDELLAKLVGQLQAPLYGLHNALSWNMKQLVWTVKAISDKKTDTAVSS